MDFQKMFNAIFTIALLSFSFSNLQAQDAANYKSAVGLRLGSPVAVTYKHFLNDDNAFEVFGSFRAFNGYSWIAASGAYQIHNDFPDVDNLKWYYGAGGSVYFYSFDTGFGGNSGSTAVGINGYIGLDYKIESAPVSITIDWIPTFFLNGFTSGFGSGFGSVGVRYVLD